MCGPRLQPLGSWVFDCNGSDEPAVLHAACGACRHNGRLVASITALQSEYSLGEDTGIRADG